MLDMSTDQSLLRKPQTMFRSDGRVVSGRRRDRPVTVLVLAFCVTGDSKTTIKLSKIKPTGTQDFNVENPSNKEEKITGASQQYFTISGEVTNALGFTICSVSRATAYKSYL